MENMSNDEVFQLAIRRYGKHAQIGQFHEEVGELMVAINKYNRHPSILRLSNIAEEIADVEIMLEQLKLIFCIEQSNVTEIKKAKIQRLKERISHPFNHGE